MKKNDRSLTALLPLLLLLLLLPALAGCSKKDDDADKQATTWDKYTDYREANLTWLAQEELRTNPDGTPFYERLSPAWNPNAYILIHWFNDRRATAGNLQPMLTSTANVWYVGRNYKYQVFDADSTSVNGRTFAVNGVIDGWQIALQYMHVEDTVQIVCPYQQAYGSSTPSALILPYSALQFNIRLRDLPTYEVKP